MVTDKQKIDYLDEHLPYMLKMLRYTHTELSLEQHYLQWNAKLESFAVHARNLEKFLSNNDTGNFKACDIIPNFRISPQEIAPLMTKLEAQVFHLGKSRSRDKAGKISTAEINKMYLWVEEKFTEFLVKLSPEFRPFFNDKLANPNLDEEFYTSTGPTGPAGPPL
jgi:hypothetical protein